MAYSACPICKTKETTEFFRSKLPFSVRSDATPVEAPSVVLQCGSCGHLFKEHGPRGGRADYEDYHLATRNDRELRLLEKLKALSVIKAGTRVLDYGCNRGTFLSGLSGSAPGTHAGFDLSEQHRAAIESMGHSYYTPGKAPPAEMFDLLSLIHVYEHMETQPGDMKSGLAALKKDGAVLIEVPDPLTAPTDLYVIDHCHHFVPSTLDRSLALSGLNPTEDDLRGFIPGEITRLYRRTGVPVIPAHENPALFEKVHSALTSGEETLLELKASGKTFAVYGCGLIGVLIASVLKGQIRGFVDDDPRIQGGRVMNLPIQGPDSLKGSGVQVIVAVPAHASRSVKGKCDSLGLSAVIPFTIAPARSQP